jgi:hypothetical protein
MLLGVTGDQVLPKEVYEKIKAETLSQVRGTVQADILKRRPGTEHVHFLNRICFTPDGRCATILYQ